MRFETDEKRKKRVALEKKEKYLNQIIKPKRKNERKI